MSAIEMSNYTKKNSLVPSVKECEIPIKGYCVAHKMRNTLVAMALADKLHANQQRDGGAPYIIHPLMTTKYLIDLEIREQLENWPAYNKDDINSLFDPICAACMLHDVIEDCFGDDFRDAKKKAKEFFDQYHLDTRVYDWVLKLSKDKNAFKDNENRKEAEVAYYNGLQEEAVTMLLKIVDRTNNCSTMDVFTKERMIKYVYEVKEFYYPMCAYLRKYYPEFSNAVTIMKYLLESICETVASMLELHDVINREPERYKKTFDFIRYYAKGSMRNTLVALALSSKYYSGYFRQSQDPFIVHPLRVCSYLINLKVTDDEICAAALLHEVPKKWQSKEESWETLFRDTYKISQRTIDLVNKVSNSKNLSKEEYYKELAKDPDAFIIKLSNRAHTCTYLSGLTYEQIDEFVMECIDYIYPLCDELSMLYPEYTDAIILAKYHIQAVNNITIRLQEIKKEEENQQAQ